MKFLEIAKAEFAYTARAYFMPVTFLWILATKGWTTAKKHFLDSWNDDGPLYRSTKKNESASDQSH